MAIPYSRYIVGSLPWYSVLMVSAILIAYLLGTREEKRIGLPKDSMLDMVLVAVPCGIVGARLYYVLMTLDQFAKNPISIFLFLRCLILNMVLPVNMFFIIIAHTATIN